MNGRRKCAIVLVRLAGSVRCAARYWVRRAVRTRSRIREWWVLSAVWPEASLWRMMPWSALWILLFCLCLTGLPVLSLMFGFVWSDFAALPCGWLNSVVLALYGLVLLFCLDAV